MGGGETTMNSRSSAEAHFDLVAGSAVVIGDAWCIRGCLGALRAKAGSFLSQSIVAEEKVQKKLRHSEPPRENH